MMFIYVKFIVIKITFWVYLSVYKKGMKNKKVDYHLRWQLQRRILSQLKYNALVIRAFYFNTILILNNHTIDSFNLLATDIKKPNTMIKTPVQTKFTNGLVLAEIESTSLGRVAAELSPESFEKIN